MRKIIFLLISFSLLLSLLSLQISAEQQNLGTFKQGDCINIKQTCANCTYSNITSIDIGGQSTEVLTNSEMTRKGVEYNYSFCNTSINGHYIVNGVSDVDGILTNWAYDFNINGIGQELTSSKANSYILIFIISVLVFSGLFILGLFLPSYNNSDAMTGYVLAVSNLKYLKFIFLGLSYLIAVFISYLSWMISYSYLDMEFLNNILRFIFTAMVVLILPGFILFIYITIANLIRDSKINEMLMRGFKVRDGGNNVR